MATSTKNGRIAEHLDAVDAAKKTPTTIPKPNYEVAAVRIVGTAPLVQNKFSAKAREMMRQNQEAGPQAKKGRKKEAKDFHAAFLAAAHRGPNGEFGIPAPAFRNAMIDACRAVGFKMTHAKMFVFVEADFLDVDEGTPLVRLDAGEPEYTEMAVRNESGVADIRPRPMWREWAVNLRVRYNADQFSAIDVLNLLEHAGIGVGVGEGRPFSKNSAGMGWGTFRVE
jgi:hypothetical protein